MTPEDVLAERCRRIELLVLDVDGVLTDGRIVYTDNGIELKYFHVRDGSGLKMWQMAGKKVAILSGRESAAVERRAAELGITTVVQGLAAKRASYDRILAEQHLQPDQACFMGDDLQDLPLLHCSGLAVAVADACAEVLAAAHHITKAAGGNGAVREAIELILRCQGRWQPLVDGATAAG